jgi:hypothetical protein
VDDDAPNMTDETEPALMRENPVARSLPEGVRCRCSLAAAMASIIAFAGMVASASPRYLVASHTIQAHLAILCDSPLVV